MGVTVVAVILLSVFRPRIYHRSDGWARARVDAQTLSSIDAVYEAATGVSLVKEMSGDLRRTVDEIFVGRTIDTPGSPFHGQYFGFNGEQRSPEHMEVVLAYLQIEDNRLIYNSSAKVPRPHRARSLIATDPKWDFAILAVALAGLMISTTLWIIERQRYQE